MLDFQSCGVLAVGDGRRSVCLIRTGAHTSNHLRPCRRGRSWRPYLTLTATCALVQQHWNPPPPSPVESLPCTRRMYSPGALKVAVVLALPPSSIAIFGLGFSNFTAPGPRNIVHVNAIGGGGVNSGGAPAPPGAPAAPRPRPAPRPCAPAAASPAAASPAAAAAPRPAAPRPRPRPSGMLTFGPSSVAHTVSVSGVSTVAVYFSAMPIGAPVNSGPSARNFNFGGVFLLAASS